MIVRREDDPLLTNLASSPLPALCAYNSSTITVKAVSTGQRKIIQNR